MTYRLFLVFILLVPILANAQNMNSNWVFGDSAGIDFSNVNNPVPISTGMDGRGSCASISDSSGNLLFYAFTVANTTGRTTHVFNKHHSLMDNGDSIIGEAWYQELIIIPVPNSFGMYYLFSIGSVGTSTVGLFYSVIDINENAGDGKVILKNIQLNGLYAFDGLTAVKHGNGRDWWLLFKPEGYLNVPNNDFYAYLITPIGINSQPVQSIGFIVTTNSGSISFPPSGSKLLMVDHKNLIQVFDFDRCTGVLSNATIIEPEDQGQTGFHKGSAFSPNEDIIYVTHVADGPGLNDSRLYQYDLNAANIASSRDTIFQTTIPNQLGRLKMGPDMKIYLSTWYISFVPGYPYPDSIRNITNENLSVINNPDSLGALCDFQPFSFYLGGKRTYLGLPNNPDYTLPQLYGSSCDTLGLTVSEHIPPAEELNVFYHSGWQMAFINVTVTVTVRSPFAISIHDLSGRMILKEEGLLSQPFFIMNLNCRSFAKGLYIVTFQNGNSFMSKKMLIQ